MPDENVQIASLQPDEENFFQTLRRELGVTSFGINLLTLAPRKRLRVHLHERQEEVYLVVEGELTLIVEGEPRVLGVGDLARVAPEARRQLTNPSAARTVVLALGGAGEHESRDARAWTGWDEEGEGRSPQEVPLPHDLRLPSATPGGRAARGCARAISAKSPSCVTTGSPCSIAVAAISASVSFTVRCTPAARQSATSRAQLPITASLIGIGSAACASASVSPRRACVASSPALSTPSCSSPIVTTDTATRDGSSGKRARPRGR